MTAYTQLNDLMEQTVTDRPSGETVSEQKYISDLPFKEASEELTGFEVIGIQKYFNQKFEDLGGMKALMGTVWAYKNRVEKTGWPSILEMTISQLYGSFPEEDPDPESDQANLSESENPNQSG